MRSTSTSPAAIDANATNASRICFGVALNGIVTVVSVPYFNLNVPEVGFPSTMISWTSRVRRPPISAGNRSLRSDCSSSRKE